MAINSSERRALTARSNRLKANLTISEVRDSVVEHVRQGLARDPLMKVRVSTTDRDDVKKVAEELAARVPCELVRTVGRVMVLYRAPDDDSAQSSAEHDR